MKNVTFETFLVGNQGWCIKGQMLRKLILFPKSIFRFILLVNVHLKTDKVDLKIKPLWKLHIFAIPSSSRHWKHCQKTFWLFQYSRNSQCLVNVVMNHCDVFLSFSLLLRKSMIYVPLEKFDFLRKMDHWKHFHLVWFCLL